ncbi:MAG: SGNH/GDSL hydrolase family protein [Muribaculaceae bacterium]|nr:SGNH/GDSL hydrolase family protein [Muribaculaceae bacterium]
MKVCKLLILALLTTLSVSGADLKYCDAAEFPLIGKGTTATSIRYTRLPDSLENISRKAVWNLGRNTAGLAVRFASNSTAIGAKWTSWLEREMNHMTPTGIRGLDLYCLQQDGTWTFVNSGRPRVNKKSTETVIISDMIPEMREYMLYLPLYDGVDSLYIGIDSTAVIEAPKAALPVSRRPIVFYGTSILQGGCASRPGMAHTNIIERKLNRETINLGFSGNGQLDYEIAEVMAAIDAGMYILDFVPNASVKQMDEQMERFYRIIRARRPEVPILFIEDPLFPHMRFNKVVERKVLEKNEALRRNYDKLKQAGEKNIYYLKADKILGDDHESTVDGNHFTDLGFAHYADLLIPIIKKHLK